MCENLQKFRNLQKPHFLVLFEGLAFLMPSFLHQRYHFGLETHCVFALRVVPREELSKEVERLWRTFEVFSASDFRFFEVFAEFLGIDSTWFKMLLTLPREIFEVLELAFVGIFCELSGLSRETSISDGVKELLRDLEFKMVGLLVTGGEFGYVDCRVIPRCFGPCQLYALNFLFPIFAFSVLGNMGTFA